MPLYINNKRTGHHSEIGCGCLVIIVVILFLAAYGLIRLLGI